MWLEEGRDAEGRFSCVSLSVCSLGFALTRLQKAWEGDQSTSPNTFSSAAPLSSSRKSLETPQRPPGHRPPTQATDSASQLRVLLSHQPQHLPVAWTQHLPNWTPPILGWELWGSIRTRSRGRRWRPGSPRPAPRKGGRWGGRDRCRLGRRLPAASQGALSLRHSRRACLCAWREAHCLCLAANNMVARPGGRVHGGGAHLRAEHH